MTQDDIMKTLSLALAEIEDDELVFLIKQKLIVPRKQNRVWAPEQEYPVWLVRSDFSYGILKKVRRLPER